MVGLLVIVALLLSPIYLWASGLPQLAHIIASIAIVLKLAGTPFFLWDRFWIFGLLFLVYSTLISLVVFAVHGDLHTILSPLYYAFGFAIFLLLVSLAHTKHGFLKKVFWVHAASLPVIALMAVAGLGGGFGELRMVGTFNDPNQMANWLLWSAIIVGASGRAVYGSWFPGLVALIPATLGIVFTASRSGALSLAFLVALYLAMVFAPLLRFVFSRVRINKKIMVGISMAVVIGVVVLLMNLSDIANLGRSIAAQAEFLIARFGERVVDDTLVGRGYDRIWLFPEYLVLGAGEGAHERFAHRTPFLGEIHSSWAGLLFNYGVIGFLLFFGFLYGVLRRITDKRYALMFLAPFVFGFSTYNIRNWYFWVGLAVLYASYRHFYARKHSSEGSPARPANDNARRVSLNVNGMERPPGARVERP